MRILKKILAFFFIFLIKVYQVTLSPFLGGHCRYQPSCSHYSIKVIQKYGPLKGGWLALKRILSCHPWGGSGYDPVL